MKIAFCTLGCKVNQYETDLLKERAEKLKYLIVDFEDISDIYCINSCSVTNMSDRKTRQMISKAKSKNPKSIVAVLGCNVDSVNDIDVLKSYNAEIVLGNRDKLNLFEEIEEYNKNRKQIIKLLDINKVKEYKEKYTLVKGYDVREQVKIEDGCDNFCSYCVIPYVRGRIRSKKEETVINEVKSLVKNGVKEVILVGIEISSYGRDLENTSLIDLIEKINCLEGLERIRLSSLDPRFLTEENIERLSKVDKLCDHFHISMQSLDDEILNSMNRKYTAKDIINICNILRKYFNNPFIATDIIVGFPGETEDMFNNTLNNLKKVQICEIHVFKYSKRQITRAAKMQGQVSGIVKKERSNILLGVGKANKEKYIERYLGKKLKVLFEHYEDGINTGLTSNYIKVSVKGNNLCGTIQDVEGISLDKEEMIGRVHT